MCFEAPCGSSRFPGLCLSVEEQINGVTVLLVVTPEAPCGSHPAATTKSKWWWASTNLLEPRRLAEHLGSLLAEEHTQYNCGCSEDKNGWRPGQGRGQGANKGEGPEVLPAGRVGRAWQEGWKAKCCVLYPSSAPGSRCCSGPGGRVGLELRSTELWGLWRQRPRQRHALTHSRGAGLGARLRPWETQTQSPA